VTDDGAPIPASALVPETMTAMRNRIKQLETSLDIERKINDDLAKRNAELAGRLADVTRERNRYHDALETIRDGSEYPNAEARRALEK
jgi:hypothetical protein